jgi:hypothetical protein
LAIEERWVTDGVGIEDIFKRLLEGVIGSHGTWDVFIDTGKKLWGVMLYLF